MLRQLGRPLRLDRGHGLKDLLINTHPSSLLLLSPFFCVLFSLLPSLSPGCIEASEKMERPTTPVSEKASPLLASSFVLFEGERCLSPFPLFLHLSLCITHLFSVLYSLLSPSL